MDLAVNTRETTNSNSLKKEGLIPAELYGKGIENMHLAVNAKEFKKIVKEAGESTVITLHIGSKKQPVLVQDIQRDPLTGEMIHVDFHGIRMDEKITAHVAIELVGESPAVKEHGGLLNQVMAEIEIEALPADLPHSIKADISGLAELEQSLHVKDLVLPKGVKIDIDPETVIANVSAPVAEEVAPVAAPDVSEVKVESEEKKAEREKDKEESGA